MHYPLDRESDPVNSFKLGSVLFWFEEEEKPWELGKYRHLKNQKETGPSYLSQRPGEGLKLLVDFFSLSPVTAPEVFTKVNSFSFLLEEVSKVEI